MSPKKAKPGQCPVCGSCIHDYLDWDRDGQYFYDEVECTVCGAIIKENYHMHYTGPEVLSVEPNMVTPDM